MRADVQELFDAAVAVQANAYVPYSRFPVGAAVRSATGRVYVGCNVENAAYPQGWCAKTSAIAAMVSAGERELAVVLTVCEGDMLSTLLRRMPPEDPRVRHGGNGHPRRRARRCAQELLDRGAVAGLVRPREPESLGLKFSVEAVVLIGRRAYPGGTQLTGEAQPCPRQSVSTSVPPTPSSPSSRRGDPVVIPNAEGRRTTPSVVAFSKAGEVLVGEVAKRQAITNPDRTFRSIKRHMGEGWKSDDVDGKTVHAAGDQRPHR